jgi:hypothetical protein
MRDLAAAGVAFLLLVIAASLATTLTFYRKRRRQNREREHSLGRAIIAEIPADDDLVLFTEDSRQFHYGAQSVDKDAIAAVRVLINGAPIAACVSKRQASGSSLQPTSFEDRPEGIARDRWDVAIERVNGTMLVECGAIRERISQELARAVFEAVRRDIERRDAGS